MILMFFFILVKICNFQQGKLLQTGFGRLERKLDLLVLTIAVAEVVSCFLQHILVCMDVCMDALTTFFKHSYRRYRPTSTYLKRLNQNVVGCQDSCRLERPLLALKTVKKTEECCRPLQIYLFLYVQLDWSLSVPRKGGA